MPKYQKNNSFLLFGEKWKGVISICDADYLIIITTCILCFSHFPAGYKI